MIVASLRTHATGFIETSQHEELVQKTLWMKVPRTEFRDNRSKFFSPPSQRFLDRSVKPILATSSGR
jgi:hypothetical protein